MRPLDPRAWVRIGAVVMVAAVVVASLVVVSRHQASRPAIAAASRDPLNAELDRCRMMGPDSAKDPACREAWARLRVHFFARDTAEAKR